MPTRPKRPLKMKRTFEPDRLALRYQQEAYERLVPRAMRLVPDRQPPVATPPIPESRKEKSTL